MNESVPALTDQDLEHLRLLSLFHYILAGVTALAGLLPVFHLLIGLGFLRAPDSFQDAFGPPPILFGVMSTVIPLFIIVMMESMALLIAFAGRRLAQHRSHTFCLVVAGLMLTMNPPLGTALGVLSLVVLLRPAVKQLFEEHDALYAY